MFEHLFLSKQTKSEQALRRGAPCDIAGAVSSGQFCILENVPQGLK